VNFPIEIKNLGILAAKFVTECNNGQFKVDIEEGHFEGGNTTNLKVSCSPTMAAQLTRRLNVSLINQLGNLEK
jgi:hypothetical protein